MMAGKSETIPIRNVEVKETMAVQQCLAHEDAVLLGDFNFRSELNETHQALEQAYVFSLKLSHFVISYVDAWKFGVGPGDTHADSNEMAVEIARR